MLHIRRAAVLVTLLALVQAASLLALTGADPAAASARHRPNIVLISTDDQAVSDLRWMPRTRALIGRHGARLTDFIAPNPLCCPARSTILTGRYSHNTGVRWNGGPRGGYAAFDPSNTLATWLDAAGYRTAFIGKYLNHYRRAAGREPGWDRFQPFLGRPASYFRYTMSVDGVRTRFTGVHSDDTITAATRRRIRRFSGRAAPFFVWASYVAPHTSCTGRRPHPCGAPPQPARRHAHLYPNAVAPALGEPSFNERDVRDKPPRIASLPRVRRASVQRRFTQRIRTLASVDEGVARTIRTLRRTGELRRTIVVFTTDNGIEQGEHRLRGKAVPYRESLRLPMLLRGPRIPDGVRRTVPASQVDLAPTLAAAARVRPRLVVDGRNLLPLIRSARRPQRVRVIEEGSARGPWSWRGIVAGRYTYTRWRGGFEELYDHRTDPYELRNRADDPAYSRVRGALRDRFLALRDCAGSDCRAGFARLPRPGR